MIVLDPDKPIEFVPSRYRALPASARPVIYVMPPTARRFMAIMEYVTRADDGVFVFRGESALKVCAMVICGWNDLITDRHGSPVAFPGPDRAVEMLDYRTLMEIGHFVLASSGVPDELAGNSESESASPSANSDTNAEGEGVKG